MKLVHSKSTAEPIVAVSACPCANLFGLVTFSAVTVYRSTTLTTVFTFPLAPFQPSETGNSNSTYGSRNAHHKQQAEHYHCCWSPSGRLFTLALSSGMILIFDVEGGTLARVFNPAGTSVLHGKGSVFTSAPLSPSAAAAAAGSAPSPSPASPFSSTGASSLPTTVPWVATTLPADCPVLAMTWCGVPSLASAQFSTMARDVQTRCLPVRLGVTAALFDETTQGVVSGTTSGDNVGDALTDVDGFVGDGNPNDGGDGDVLREQDQREYTTLVSLLTVLGSDGVLRCFVGGLYEVYATTLALPDSLKSRNLLWKDVHVENLQWRQCAWEPRSLTNRADGPIRVCSGLKGASAPRAAALISFGDAAIDPVLPATTQQHRLYLTVRIPFNGATLSTSTESGTGDTVSQVLWEACLLERLTALATPPCLAICYAREYARLAHEAYERVLHGWHGVLRGRVLTHLGLPPAAPLLCSAIVAQVTDPDPIALFKYAKQTLMRDVLADDLEALAKMFRTVTYEVTHVCYRCCEVAMAYAVYTTGGTAAAEDNGLLTDDYGNLSQRDTLSTDLVSQLGALRHEYEVFLREAADEGECARDLALWVMQQSIYWESGTHFVMTNSQINKVPAADYSEEDRHDAFSSPTADRRAGSPSPVLQSQQQPLLIDEVPVSATRQPSLYNFLMRVVRMYDTTNGKATSPIESWSGNYDSGAARLYEQLSAYAEQRTSVLSAHAPLQATVVDCKVVVGDDANDTERQLLCCVVTDNATGGGGGDVSSNSNWNSLDDDGDAASSLESAVGHRHKSEEENEDNEENGHRRSGRNTNMEDLSDYENYGGGFTRFTAAAPRIASQSAKVYALRSLVRVKDLIGSISLSSCALLLKSAEAQSAQREGTINDEQVAAATAETVEPACEPVQLSVADVDVASLEKKLKSDFSNGKSISFTSSWYGFLEEDRHVLVCQPSGILTQSPLEKAKAACSNAPFFIAIVKDDGKVVIADERDDGDEDENEEKNEDALFAENATNAKEAAASRAALCQVTGMEGVRLRVSMSRARSFCVIVGVAKYVVVSLYDDDY